MMKSNSLTEFSVNKENNTILLSRNFNASLELVWQAWTSAEYLTGGGDRNPGKRKPRPWTFGRAVSGITPWWGLK